MDQVNSSGVTGSKAKFTVDLPRHSLSFTTKLEVTEANLPSEASIDLPKVHVSAEYIQDGKSTVEAKLAGKIAMIATRTPGRHAGYNISIKAYPRYFALIYHRY